MAEQAAVKLNRARALIRESQQWAARMNRILLSVELCQIDGRLFETMEKYHVLPPWSGAKKAQAAAKIGNGVPKSGRGPQESPSCGRPAGPRAPQAAEKGRPTVLIPSKNSGPEICPLSSVSPVPGAPTAPKAMPQFAAVSPPPQELLIDFAGDIAVVAASQAVQGEALSKEKNEVQVTMPGVIVSSPIEPERDGLICLDSDSETYAKSNINPKDFQAAVSNHAPVAPVFTPMAMSGAISGTLISFDDDVEIIPMTVAPVMTCLDQKVDEDLLLEDHVVKEYPTATNEVISPALNPSLDETKDSQLGDQGISAAPLESVNTPSTPGNIAAVSTGKAVDAKLSGASPALCSDDYVPNLDTYPCLVDDRSAVLFPVDESPLGVSPKFVVDPDDQASSCLQELRVLLEKHWETTIRV